MQHAQSPQQLKYCEINLTLHAKFTKTVKKLSFMLMANVSYECSKAVAGRRAASGTSLLRASPCALNDILIYVI